MPLGSSASKQNVIVSLYFDNPSVDTRRQWFRVLTRQYPEPNVMSDKRQRARVQGSWAKPMPKQPQRHTEGGVGRAFPSNSIANIKPSWGVGQHTFEFHQSTQPIKLIPSEKVIEKDGDYEVSHGPSGVSRLRLFTEFLPLEEADWMFSKLLAELPWSQKINYRQGESYGEPRLTCWYGELPYTYANSTMEANTQWHPLLLTLRQAVESASRLSFNSLLCNLYRNESDSIAWHSDDEASLGTKPTIASLSLGATRVFSLRKKPPPEENGDYTYTERLRVPLAHGTLLLMEGATQDDWQHQVAKEYHSRGPRINLTFRTIHSEPAQLKHGGHTMT